MWTWCSKHEYRREGVESVGIFNYFRYLVFYTDPNTNFLVLVLILVLLLHLCLFSFDILKNFSIKWLLMQNKLRKQLTWCKIWTLFKTFWPWNCATSLDSRLSSISFLFLFGKSLICFVPFLYVQRTVLHVWSHRINGEERITSISLYVKLLWCHEVMFLVAFLTIVEMEKIF